MAQAPTRVQMVSDDQFQTGGDELEQMPGFAEQTAYYLSKQPPRIALIGKGVRFPAGHWFRVADELLPAWVVQDLVPSLFPALAGKTVPIVSLLTEFDVQEFEVACETARDGGLPD